MPVAGSDPHPLTIVLIALWAPASLMIVSFLSLLQFKVFYTAFTTACHARAKLPLWRSVQPVLKRILSNMEISFGPATKFAPGLTHVLLVAVLLAVLATPLLGGRRR